MFKKPLSAALLALSLFISPASAGVAAYSNPLDATVPQAREVRAADGAKLAFPSALGYGRFASVGPTPTIYKVTNLNDSGTGSFRACWMAVGPRVCVFTVSGTITLTSDMLARDAQSKVYVAGQTSPGGIQFKLGPGTTAGPFRGANGPSNVIIRFVASRPGIGHTPSTNVQGIGSIGGDYRTWNTKDIILDHVSEQWATDEGISLAAVDNATLQWSLQSEPIANATARGGSGTNHDYGAFLVSNNRFTVVNNLFMSGRIRNPNIAANIGDMVNNVIYNYANNATQCYVNIKVSCVINFISNWYSIGPRPGNMQETGQRPHCILAANEGTPAPGLGHHIYVNGNICRHDLTGTDNIGKGVVYQGPGLKKPDGTTGVISTTPVHGGVNLPSWTNATTAFMNVATFAGSIRDIHATPRRDAVDARAVSQLRSCTGQAGSISQPPSPGYPTMTATYTFVDNDNDGMNDNWELLYKGDLSLTPHADTDGDGWTNLEEFLNYYAGEHIVKTGVGPVPAPYCGKTP